MITYKTGNLFTTDAPVIVHGCNCQGRMGSGIAKQIKENYPEAFDAYISPIVTKLTLGNIIPASTGSKFIINALTQDRYGFDGKLYTDYDAVRTCMKKISRLLLPQKPVIAMPKIGCGLGGGDWNIISKIIEEELKDFEVEVWEL